MNPRMFALVDEGGDGERVVGYGLALPDGTAVSVSWPARPGHSYYSTDNPEQSALLRGAALVWITDQGGAGPAYTKGPEE